MYARSALMTVTDEHRDEVLSLLREDMGPRYAETPGFCAFTAQVNRERSQVFGTSFWRTEEDRDRAEELGRSLRARINEIAGTEIQQYQRWEVLYFDLRGPTSQRARSMLVTVGEERYDDLVAMLENDMGPLYANSAGFCGFSVVVDRAQRQLFGLSFWKTEDDRDRASELGRRLRAKVNDIAGVHNPAFQLWEVVYFEVREPARR
jgi:heme-degrading monooxygenase HmoA